MKTNLLNLITYFNFIFCLISFNLSFSQTAIILEASFEDNSLPDGTGDGRDSWRVPDNNTWSPIGVGNPVIQITVTSQQGLQAAKFPSNGERIAYQEIEVTPNTEYALTYYTSFTTDTYGEMALSILKPSTTSYAQAKLTENIIATRTDNNTCRFDFTHYKKHSLIFNSGEYESVIIFATNTGVETGLDSFEIITNPSSIQRSLTTQATNGTIMLSPEPTNGTYDYGTEVIITATPNEGYQFDGFSNDTSTCETNTKTIIIDSNENVIAYFSKTQHTLTTEVVNGTITLSPEPINGAYEYGTEVTLTAIPNENYTFKGWWFGYEETSDNLTIIIEKDITVAAIFPKIDENFIPNPIIMEASFEGELFSDNDPRDPWRAPNNTTWNPLEADSGTTQILISRQNEECIFPDGTQAAWLQTGGGRVAYQEIQVTPNSEYVLTFFSAFNHEFEVNEGELTVSVLKPTTTSYSESLLEENIIASRTLNLINGVDDVFVEDYVLFDSGENESVIIFATNTDTEVRLDAFDIVVNSSLANYSINSQAENGTITLDPEPVNGQYLHDTEVTLTAVPNEGYEFESWNCSLSELSISIIMNRNKTINAFFRESDITLGVENSSFENQFTISPNPTSDYINISTNDLDAIQQITIVNMLGEEITKTKETKINVSNLPNGLYLLKIEDKNSNVVTNKFIKE